jgi:uncharacterized protein YqeY
MSLKDKILSDLTAAMKAQDALRLEVLRAIKSAIKMKEVSGATAATLDEAGVLQVLTSLVKQRQESILQFRQGNREDLAKKEEAELAILQGYLPAALSETELKAIVTSAIAEIGAASPKDMGKVMKLVTPKTTGRADGKAVSQLVQQLLTAKVSS